MQSIPIEAFQNAPFMFHSINNKGIITNVSDEWLNIFGYTRDEVIGRESTDFLTDEAKIYAKNVVLPEYFKTGQCKNIHYQCVKKDGTIFDILLSATSQYDDDGNFVSSLAFLTDVTDLKLIDELIEAKEMYKTLSRVSPVGIIRIDEKNKCSYVNKTWQEFTGMTSNDALGEGWKKSIHPEDRYRVVREWNKCARASEGFSFEYRILSNDGDIVWVLAQANLVNSGGKGYVGTLTDITNNKEILPQILEIKKETKVGREVTYGLAGRT